MIDPKDRIDEGDIVAVTFVGQELPIERAEVLGTPSDTGDSWKLRVWDKAVERIVYVQLFETMTRIKRRDNRG